MSIAIDKIQKGHEGLLPHTQPTNKQILLGIKPKPKPVLSKRKSKNPNIIRQNIEVVETLRLYGDGRYSHDKNINGILIAQDHEETPKDNKALDSTDYKKPNKPLHINVIPVDKKTKENGTFPDYTNPPVEEVVSEIFNNNKTTPENITSATEEKSADIANNVAKTFVELAKKVGFGGKNNKDTAKIYDDIYKKAFNDINQKLSYGVLTKQFNQLKKKANNYDANNY